MSSAANARPGRTERAEAPADDYVPRHRRADPDPEHSQESGVGRPAEGVPDPDTGHPRGRGFGILSRLAREHATTEPGGPDSGDNADLGADSDLSAEAPRD